MESQDRLDTLKAQAVYKQAEIQKKSREWGTLTTYACEKCGNRHYTTSNIGIAHRNLWTITQRLRREEYGFQAEISQIKRYRYNIVALLKQADEKSKTNSYEARFKAIQKKHANRHNK